MARKRTLQITDSKDLGGSKDLTGQIFSNFTVLSLEGTNINNGKIRSFWKVRCNCGYETIKDQKQLFRQTSLGRTTCKICSKDEDITGRVYNNYSVESFNSREPDGKFRQLWNIVCNCGKKYIKPKLFLTKHLSNNSHYCSNCFYDKLRVPKPPEDIIGKTFNNFTIIELMPKDPEVEKYIWKVKCNCGHYSYKSITDLTMHVDRKGKACVNCVNIKGKVDARIKQKENLIGKIFGNFKVLEYVGKDKRKNRVWLVQCKCGSEPVERTTGELTVAKKEDNPTCHDCYNRSFIGKKYGSFKILSFIKDESIDNFKFEVICLKCNNKFFRTRGSLVQHVEKTINGHYCLGCKEPIKPGVRINNFTVLNLIETNYKDSTVKTVNCSYRIKCDCGEEYIRSEYTIKQIVHSNQTTCEKCIGKKLNLKNKRKENGIKK